MEKNRICKICNRRFPNGKAMGGHMRSHLAKLPLPPKPQQQRLHYPISLKSPNSLTSSSSSSLNFPPSPQNPFQSYRSVNHELVYVSKQPAVDGESETESPRNTTRRRSKRSRKSMEKVAESVVRAAESSPEQVSSISDEIFNEEDVALCLLMLSKDDKRLKNESENESEEETEIDEDVDESFEEIPFRSKSNGRYKCETCKKIFRSYQALGGHKASHKKIRKVDDYDGTESRTVGCGSGGGASSSAAFVDHKIYKCPFCEKVFDSGQALGGHKKVHFSYLGNNVNKIKPKSKSGDNLLDLNLPAPEDDDDNLN